MGLTVPCPLKRNTDWPTASAWVFTWSRQLLVPGTHPKLFLWGLSPRYYAVNKDRFALYFHADLGLGQLRIGDVRKGVNLYTDHYSGGHLRLGTAVQFYFGSVVGLNLGLKYAANNLKWRDRSPGDPLLDAVNYSARLKTSGVQFQLGLQAVLDHRTSDRTCSRA